MIRIDLTVLFSKSWNVSFIHPKSTTDLRLPPRAQRNLTVAQTDGMASNSWLGLEPNQTSLRQTNPSQINAGQQAFSSQGAASSIKQ